MNIRLPDLIEVTKDAVVIDGQDFPWPITEDGVAVKVRYDHCPSITITIPANRVTVDHSS